MGGAEALPDALLQLAPRLPVFVADKMPVCRAPCRRDLMLYIATIHRHEVGPEALPRFGVDRPLDSASLSRLADGRQLVIRHRDGSLGGRPRKSSRRYALPAALGSAHVALP